MGSTIGCNRPKRVKLILREHKLRGGVYWQGAVKQQCIQQVEHKTRA